MSLERFKKLAWRWILFTAVLCSLCALVLLITGTTEQRTVALSGFGLSYEFALWAPLVWDALSLVAWVALGFRAVRMFLFDSVASGLSPLAFLSLFLCPYIYHVHVTNDIGIGMLVMFLAPFIAYLFIEVFGIEIGEFEKTSTEFDHVYLSLIILAGIAFGIAVSTKLGPTLGMAAIIAQFVVFFLGVFLGLTIEAVTQKTFDAAAFCKRKGSAFLQWLFVRTLS